MFLKMGVLRQCFLRNASLLRSTRFPCLPPYQFFPGRIPENWTCYQATGILWFYRILISQKPVYRKMDSRSCRSAPWNCWEVEGCSHHVRLIAINCVRRGQVYIVCEFVSVPTSIRRFFIRMSCSVDCKMIIPRLGILCVRCAQWEREREREKDERDVTYAVRKLAMSSHLSFPKNSQSSFWNSQMVTYHYGAEVDDKLTLSVAKNSSHSLLRLSQTAR